jgi:hypothetical protein
MQNEKANLLAPNSTYLMSEMAEKGLDFSKDVIKKTYTPQYSLKLSQRSSLNDSLIIHSIAFFDGLRSGTCHCPSISWPNFFQGQKCPKSWFFTNSMTIEPPKLFLDPHTIKSIMIHSMGFFKAIV